MPAYKVAIITGSTRSPRAGNTIVDYIASIIASRPDNGTDNLEFSNLQIADFNLPVFDEPVVPAMVPAMAQFTKEHSKKWSAAVGSYQAYIWVIPEYNGGLAGGTKNAVDFLYNELIGKPTAIISYGIKGGNRANEQLEFALGTVIKAKIVDTKVILPFAEGNDVYSAIAGILGEDSKKSWKENGKEDEILKAVAEIKKVLEEPPKTEETPVA
ncbi:flavoprotein-like protein [Rhypophila decipiens]|uniref:Flavoprotein-like protein n=1 Tax=Rhypophila decipiens TaxID=261697 RepID=A0AAN6Y512_9PEZI|nr:flavoprotein-like protein [Rhypophila decipiens]